MNELIENDLKKLSAVLESESRIGRFGREEWNRGLIAGGGKLLRPRLVISTARLCGYSGDVHIGFAAAVELLHNSSLFHDDIIDSATLRRGKPSLNSVLGNSFALLAGDYFIARSFSIAARLGPPEAAVELPDCLAALVQGQLLEMEQENNLGCTRDAYERVIDLKTASLIRTSMRVGAIVASASDELLNTLTRIAGIAGRLFQIGDDIFDYVADKDDTGKIRFQDVREGKMTLPGILFAERAGADELDFFKRCMGNKALTDSDGMIILDAMNRLNVFNDILAEYKSRHDEIKSMTILLPANEFTEDFNALIENLIGRLYSSFE